MFTDKKLSRRDALRMTVAATAAASGIGSFAGEAFGEPKKPAVKSAIFYLRHWSSKHFVHPLSGGAKNGRPVVTHPVRESQARYVFEWVEGPWGWIRWADNQTFCIHPNGGMVDAGNATELVFHDADGGEQHPGAYFVINEESQSIIHISGRYWHPKGGGGINQSQPPNANPIVLFDGLPDYAKFQAVDDNNEPVDLTIPGLTTSLGWARVAGSDNPLGDEKITVKKKIGLRTTTKSKVSVEVAAKMQLQGKLFGVKSQASLAVRTAYAKENAETWDKVKEVDVEYSIKKGEPRTIWQQVYTATFADGAVFEYFCDVTSDTTSSTIKPKG